MNKPILECNGIAAGYVKGLNILQGIDLVVSEGEIISIIGPNGAGKSTLLKAIMGLINVSAGRFFINGVEINLTALEFKLLKHLIDRRGRVQTRDQLLEEVWGYSSHVTTRTVDTHVKRLREKLKEMGKHIQTIRGVGYRFSRSSE